MKRIRRSGKTRQMVKVLYKRLRLPHIRHTLVCTSDIKGFKKTFLEVTGRDVTVQKASRCWKTYWIELKPQE